MLPSSCCSGVQMCPNCLRHPLTLALGLVLLKRIVVYYFILIVLDYCMHYKQLWRNNVAAELLFYSLAGTGGE